MPDKNLLEESSDWKLLLDQTGIDQHTSQYVVTLFSVNFAYQFNG